MKFIEVVAYKETLIFNGFESCSTVIDNKPIKIIAEFLWEFMEEVNGLGNL